MQKQGNNIDIAGCFHVGVKRQSWKDKLHRCCHTFPQREGILKKINKVYKGGGR